MAMNSDANHPANSGLHQDDWVATHIAARILHLSQRRVTQMCHLGELREGSEWVRPGGECGHYLIRRSALLRRVSPARAGG